MRITQVETANTPGNSSSAGWSTAACLQHEPFRKRLGQCGDGELLLIAENRTHRAQSYRSRNEARPPAERDFQSAINHVNHILRIDRATKSIRRKDERVRLLDFGCGFGEFLETCKHFGFECYGVDRASGRRDGAVIKVLPSLDDLSVKQFHVITLFEVLEHLDDPADILAKLYPYLANGGILILETPDCTGVMDIKTLFDFRKIDPLEHINAFVHDTLKSIAERQGFKHIARGPSYVMAETTRAAKRFAKYALGRDARSTQLYFQK